MSDERPVRCETCRFWYQPTDAETACGPCDVQVVSEVYEKRVDSDGYVAAGECHRRAPTAIPVADASNWPDDARAVWPVTLPLDWCGEWRPKGDDQGADEP